MTNITLNYNIVCGPINYFLTNAKKLEQKRELITREKDDT